MVSICKSYSLCHHVIEINIAEILNKRKEIKNKTTTPFILKYYFYTEIFLNCMHSKIACLQHFIKYQIQKHLSSF